MIGDDFLALVLQNPNASFAKCISSLSLPLWRALAQGLIFAKIEQDNKIQLCSSLGYFGDELISESEFFKSLGRVDSFHQYVQSKSKELTYFLFCQEAQIEEFALELDVIKEILRVYIEHIINNEKVSIYEIQVVFDFANAVIPGGLNNQVACYLTLLALKMLSTVDIITDQRYEIINFFQKQCKEGDLDEYYFHILRNLIRSHLEDARGIKPLLAFIEQTDLFDSFLLADEEMMALFQEVGAFNDFYNIVVNRAGHLVVSSLSDRADIEKIISTWATSALSKDLLEVLIEKEVSFIPQVKLILKFYIDKSANLDYCDCLQYAARINKAFVLIRDLSYAQDAFVEVINNSTFTLQEALEKQNSVLVNIINCLYVYNLIDRIDDQASFNYSLEIIKLLSNDTLDCLQDMQAGLLLPIFNDQKLFKIFIECVQEKQLYTQSCELFIANNKDLVKKAIFDLAGCDRFSSDLFITFGKNPFMMVAFEILLDPNEFGVYQVLSIIKQNLEQTNELAKGLKVEDVLQAVEQVSRKYDNVQNDQILGSILLGLMLSQDVRENLLYEPLVKDFIGAHQELQQELGIFV